MCFSEQLRRVGSCCLAVGWCQATTPFGVPIKTGVGFTAQEADHREWSLSTCRTWSLGSVLLLAPLCMHVGRGFSGKGQGTGLLSLLQVQLLGPGFPWYSAKLFPMFLCALGTTQSPGLSAYDLEMEGISSKHRVHGQELFSGMLYIQLQCILGRLRNGLRVSSVEKLHSVYKMFTYVWLCQHLKYK